MAALLYSCVLLIICVGLARAVVDSPCNDEIADCGAGECCAGSTGAPQGFKGSCQKYKRYTEPCTPEEPKDGECGCIRHSICALSYTQDGDPGAYSCHIIRAGR